jgi:putative DNA methylase
VSRNAKKLIEVALPLDAINRASAREKSIRHGHPSTLHLWWARRPLAAARAVIFAQMVDDPSAHPDIFPTEKAQEKERQRLFRIIEDLVQWENTTNEEVLQSARDEIWNSWRRTCAQNADHPRAKELFDRYKLPAFHDPFAGGGALPLEAQRLGLEAYASDLNPVAALINKAMIEIPPKFSGRPPVNPEARGKKGLIDRQWKGAQGLAEDVCYYGEWMRDEAQKKIGYLYPKVSVTAEMVEERPDLRRYLGRELEVVAWLWARTVFSPNPAYKDVAVPLASTFMLSTKKGRKAYVEPVISDGGYRFAIRVGEPMDATAAKQGTKSGGSRSSFLCLMSGTPMPFEYLRSEAKAGRMGVQLMAVVVQGDRERVYIPPTAELESVAFEASPRDVPETEMPSQALGFRVQEYAMTRWCDLFTSRQLVSLTTFSDLVEEAVDRLRRDARESGMVDDDLHLVEGGSGALAYAEAIAVYLAFAVSKVADRGSTICTWFTDRDSTRNTFARQSIPMTWDFAELNTLLGGTGSFLGAVEWTAESLEGLAAEEGASIGTTTQDDAMIQTISSGKVISTDPPYFDNIGYADLSDFFYLWLRRSLRPLFPDLFSTVAVPKAAELIASPFRQGSKPKAEQFFLDGMTQAMRRLAVQSHPAFPVTVYYAFKQSERKQGEGVASTGWETFLGSVVRAGFGISGTWPMRTELSNRMISSGTNALASSIALVCCSRPEDAPTVSRREYVAALKRELPRALAHLQRSNIAPVDLAQAAIGPVMAVYTRYDRVLESDGTPLSIGGALSLINQVLDEVLAEQEGDFDADTRWALAWFEQTGFEPGDFGVAETLSKAKNTSVAGMVEAGILASGGGKVRLLRPDELPEDWDPATDERLTVWEMVHHLIRVLDAGGESAAAELAVKLGSQADVARELAYRLYTICDRKKRAPEALAYNALVLSWPEILRLAREGGSSEPEQVGMFEQE